MSLIMKGVSGTRTPSIKQRLWCLVRRSSPFFLKTPERKKIVSTILRHNQIRFKIKAPCPNWSYEQVQSIMMLIVESVKRFLLKPKRLGSGTSQKKIARVNDIVYHVKMMTRHVCQISLGRDLEVRLAVSDNTFLPEAESLGN